MASAIRHGLEPQPGETPASFCSRVAAAFGRTAREFCLDFGLAFQPIVDGAKDSISRLSELCGVSPATFYGSTIERVGDREFALNDQALVRDALSRSRMRVCPHCVAEDLEKGSGRPSTRVWGRAIWLLASIRTCPVHEVMLVTVSEDASPNTLHDFSTLLLPHLASVDRLIRGAVPRPLSGLESHLMCRLAGRPVAEQWLADHPFYAAAKVCETLGAFALNGPRFRVDEIDEVAMHEAGAAGFDVASGGPQAIYAMFSELRKPVEGGAELGLRSTYGRVYEWLAHETDDVAYEPLKAVVRDHVVATLPMGPGDTVFGEPVLVRRVHSIRSASLQTGAHPKRLRKVLAASGFVSADADRLADDRVLFDAEGAAELLERLSGGMSLKQAGVYLNAPRPHERMLFEAGHIRPVVAGGTDVLKDHTFSRADLDDFLQRLTSRAAASAPGTGQVAIPTAAKRACCSAMEIVELLLAERLTKVARDPDSTGYLSVLVDPNEIGTLVRREDHGGLSLRDTERLLGSSTAVVNALIETGALPSSVRLNPVNRCPQRVVLEADLDTFMRRFVSLTGLSRETGIHFRRLAADLGRSGITPAFDPGQVKATFYERAALRGHAPAT